MEYYQENEEILEEIKTRVDSDFQRIQAVQDAFFAALPVDLLAHSKKFDSIQFGAEVLSLEDESDRDSYLWKIKRNFSVDRMYSKRAIFATPHAVDDFAADDLIVGALSTHFYFKIDSAGEPVRLFFKDRIRWRDALDIKVTNPSEISLERMMENPNFNSWLSDQILGAE